MRRPRGPGGRFLTAEEIAAQKVAQAEAANADNEHPRISPDAELALSPTNSTTAKSSVQYPFSQHKLPLQHDQHQPQHLQQHLPVLDIAYHHHHRHPVPLSQSLANVASSIPQSHLPPMYAHHKSSIDPIPISTPYPMHMHHLPQHERQHHHPSYSPYAIYPPDPLPPHEMIHFGPPGVSSP